MKLPTLSFVNVVSLSILLMAYGYSQHQAQAKAEIAANLEMHLSLPADLSIMRFSDLSKLGKPRMMAVSANGDLLVTLVDTGKLVKLDAQGVATVVANDLNAPNGVVVREQDVLVAEADGVVRLPKQGEGWGPKQAFIGPLATGGHALKSIQQGPDGYLYVNVGSSCNVCVEEDATRATLLRFDQQGRPAGALVTLGRHQPSAIWAKGLRNSQGFAWHPVTGAMFATNEGADNRSEQKNGAVNDTIPPEHLNLIEAGKHYGWPYCWANPSAPNGMFQDPNFVGEANVCASAQAPAITFTSHSTPIGITFLNKSRLPTAYRDDAVVALHGSWNRAQPSGYQVVRVIFKNYQPVAVVSLIDGWLQGSRAWGRPVDVIVGHDGMLYISDDLTGWIYKVSPAHAH